MLSVYITLCFFAYLIKVSSSSIVPSIAEGILDLKVASLQDVKKGDVLFTVFSPEVLSRRNELEILSKRLSVYKDFERHAYEKDCNLFGKEVH